MKKLLSSIFLAQFLFVIFFNQVSAQAVDSYELFWPTVAGVTMDDPKYILKTLKENVRGFFIFGKAQKVDYLITLAIKRTVEAEKLTKLDKKDLAQKTFGKAEKNVQDAIDLSKPSLKSLDTSIINAGKLNKFLTFLKQEELLSKVKELQGLLR